LIILSNCWGSTISLAREGITACPENYEQDVCETIISQKRGEIFCTPAMNSPNATPISTQLPVPSCVSAGLHRLPGPSRFERPSTNITPTIHKIETMPSIEAYERRESGRKTVGINLET
jgi:hypothetical protein